MRLPELQPRIARGQHRRGPGRIEQQQCFWDRVALFYADDQRGVPLTDAAIDDPDDCRPLCSQFPEAKACEFVGGAFSLNGLHIAIEFPDESRQF
ncbi:hypothetical protein C7S16_4025 [Burkholderia thailandensis]|uniref:Uncharacterized protein n=1 Tax=Burkholderia thailandensis TaxID=57975 RepID=A0AAW9D5T9_BURTH|nr:hypothetical protein [Burkholderia thailandensis]MDW9257321.1 hypothetical protein [Burkholderia thailandensis]